MGYRKLEGSTDDAEYRLIEVEYLDDWMYSYELNYPKNPLEGGSFRVMTV
jgi:hypothetical protein